jgi:hypothetical protein
VNLCKTNPGKEKQEIEEIRSWKIVFVNDQKSEDSIRKKINDRAIQ